MFLFMLTVTQIFFNSSFAEIFLFLINHQTIEFFSTTFQKTTTELLEIELFWHLTVHKQNLYLY